MNILILNWKDVKNPKTGQVGGAEIIVYELAKRLVKDSHQVTWFCRHFTGSPEEEDISGLKIIRRGNLVTMFIWAVIYYWRLHPKPDLVIDMSNTIYWQAPLWARKSKVVAYLNQFAKEVFFYEYPPFISHFGVLIERLQYLTYRQTPFICYSQSTKNDLVQAGIPTNNIYAFPLGLDHDRYLPGSKSSTPLFLCVNRLVRMKRTDLAIRAMDFVRQRYPEAKLVIVGYGYERQRLEILRDELNLKNQVFFIDEKIFFLEKNAQDQKIDLMQKSWALVFPSVKEGWGMTVTECAACGTPTIAARVSGLVDSVQNNETGILVSKVPSPEELAAAMEKIISDSKFRLTLSKNAINFSQKFSWDQSYKEFNGILKSICAS